jgi:hypothetical protein
MGTLIQEVFEPFHHNGKVHRPLVILFILINTLVFVNTLLHDPYQGYDAGDHILYIKVLALKKEIPTCADSSMCYFPPLPYILPAIILATGRINLWEAAKFAQLIDVILSLGLTYYLLKICDLIDPQNIIYKFSSLAMLGILPVYYKTYSLIRGETYLPLLIVFIAYQILSIFLARGNTLANLILLGLAVGLSILARQWGFLVLPAIILFVIYAAFRDYSNFKVSILTMGVCILIPILVVGWYYFIMFQRYGSLTAWDRRASQISLSAFPTEFYIGTGSGKLFIDPIRPSFSNQLPAIFYSDIWGDYSAYFLVYAKDKRSGEYIISKYWEMMILSGKPLPDWIDTNRYTINSYLGRVNFVSLLPSAIFTAGFIYALILIIRSLINKSGNNQILGLTIFTLITISSLAGYGWYLLRYQNQGQGGDLIKATHMIQIFPFMGLLAGGILEKLWEWRPKFWIALMITLSLIFIHNLPAMITHFALLP